MVLSDIWCIFVLLAVCFSILNGNGSSVTNALLAGAQEGIRTTIVIAGPMCLWTGIANLMQAIGMTGHLSRIFSPFLHFLFPSAKTDPILSEYLSANFSANLLGLGNAATPMGIQAAKHLQDPSAPYAATDEMCRLVVMNTASVQLLPTTVAALRQSAGCQTPFDILPCVWITSIFSVSAGLLAAFVLKRWWTDG